MSQTEHYNILIVDDHPLVRKGLRQLISLAPALMVIGEAENGEQALALCAQEVPDLIILDLSMQGISGLDTLRILRTEQHFLHVLILTISDAREDMQTALTLGADDYFVKDSDPEILLTAIRNGARQGRLRRQIPS